MVGAFIPVPPFGKSIFLYFPAAFTALTLR